MYLCSVDEIYTYFRMEAKATGLGCSDRVRRSWYYQAELTKDFMLKNSTLITSETGNCVPHFFNQKAESSDETMNMIGSVFLPTPVYTALL